MPLSVDQFRPFLDAVTRVRSLAESLEATPRAQVHDALTEILGAHRSALATDRKKTDAGRADAYRRLYTSGLLPDLGDSSEAFLRHALTTLVQALDADAGALVVLGDDGDLERVIGHAGDGEALDDDEVLGLSETVVQRVRATRGSLNIEDAGAHNSLAAQASIVSGGLRAVMCVPMLADGEVWGAAYVDRRRSDAVFGRDDLDVLTAFVSQTGAALRLYDRFEHLRSETDGLRRRVEGRISAPALVGQSRSLLHLLDQTAAVADTDATVLITGESGTGKELLAQTLHHNSRRRGGPFVAINCGAIPESLLESTLFGHKKGAFTGAIADEPGLIASAAGGTLFLDEIGDMPPTLQVKLLRVLQTGSYTRVGDPATRQADVRWVAATHRDLAAAIQDGTFREDLYYRLCVFDLHMPALRERVEDIGLLADHFVERFAEAHGRPARRLSGEALVALEAHRWPGNVRELENVVQRAVILADGPTLLPAHLPTTLAPDGDEAATRETPQAYHDAVQDFKRRLLQRTLDATDGNRTAAADHLGLNRTYLSRLLRQLDLQNDE